MQTISKILFLILLIFNTNAQADFHTTGWVNTFIPGGGELLNDNYVNAAKEAGLEISTFALGYSLSPSDSLTLDGTPLNYPLLKNYNYLTTRIRNICTKRDTQTNACLERQQKTITRLKNNYSTQTGTKPLTAAALQEFGIKYHFINVFTNYRKQFNQEGGHDPGQGIDQRSTYEMFKDPFRGEVLLNPWVYIPIGLTTAFVIMDYHSQVKETTQLLSPLNTKTKIYSAFDQLVMYPFGSGVPEEVFYRGFLQNEFYYLYRSPYFAIPMSSLFFGLSHSQDNWPSAFATGIYQGLLAYQNHGNLAFGNAVHFWGVVVLGIEAYFLTMHSQASAPVALHFNFTY